MTNISERIANLSLEKRELLMRRLHKQQEDSQLQITPIPRETNTFPLSFAQQRLWFLDQLESNSSLYNIPAAVRLKGKLNLAALEGSLSEIFRRHEALRTTFTIQDGQPVQVVHPDTLKLFTLSVLDLKKFPQPEQETAVSQLIDEEAQRPFDLSQGPLVRATLLQLSVEEHLLLFTMHHIVSDGWSVAVFIREMAALYAAFTSERPSLLPELSIQYVDFAHWQRQWLQGEVQQKQLSYWKQQLEGASPILDLPFDRPRSPIQTFQGARQLLLLSSSLSESLKALSQQEGATLFMTLLAAFNTLLYRYTGQDDILVGSPIANRNRAETEGLIGFFVNTLVLRTQLQGNPSFRELLARVREVALGAYAHQDLPFEKLVEEFQPVRDLSRNPMFQVMFILQNAPASALELANLSLNLVDVDAGLAKFDLTLTLEETANGIAGNFEYNTGLFDAATIDRMAGHFQTLLEAIVANPEQRLDQLPFLTTNEQHQLLVEWNNTQVDYPSDVSIHQLFAAQVEKTPDAIALVFTDKQLTYRELNQKANCLAHHLQKLGVKSDVLVGIYMERSLEMIVAILGILKAGGAYLPLDPAYPQERLSFMLADAQAPVLLTQQQLLEKLPNSSASIVCLDTDWQTIQAASQQNPQTTSSPDNLAYTIYTSGSTGKPKGVMVTHRNVVNFFTGMDSRIGDEQPGTWLAVTSISFDISVLELLWTLTRGFQVAIGESVQAADITETPKEITNKEMAFSLFYFASDEVQTGTDKYRLLLEGAKFADEHGFSAIWTPERHFHEFGGLYPNPSVVSAAIATITERIQIRAGSIVLPLQNPIRVAEEWSVVDNLSRGRVGVSFASGWHADDFVLAPENYADRFQIMFRDIETVRKLWCGESITLPGGSGKEVEVKIHPQPIQPELPIWVTAAGSPETFRKAGEIGANLLTHLLGQNLDELEKKIAIYRQSRQEHGHDPRTGHVTLMIHTFVGEEIDSVREKVRQPFCQYLKTSLGLLKNLAKSLGKDTNVENLTAQEEEDLLNHAFNRYFETSSLFGTPSTCLQMINSLKAIGVDEVGCLIDFGVDLESVLSGLHHLNAVKELSNKKTNTDAADYSLAAQIAIHNVTHLQCTPSLARMLIQDNKALKAMGSLRKLMLGGEALSISLAQQLRSELSAEIYNMYGPTETTIWSATHSVVEVGSTVPIGRPIANTKIYILDRYLQPVPIGVPGELFIGGTGVVRGYLNQPELTAQKFISNPFSDQQEARLYKTGDLVRYRPDSTIEFLGRLDHQVKIRGYRIELGEIESVISKCPEVRDCAVILHEEDTTNKYLVSFVVKEAGKALAEQEIQSYARHFLPAYMVPDRVWFLDTLPLTPNGKVDRKSLKQMSETQGIVVSSQEFVAPATVTEEVLADIWAKLLKLDKVSVERNFFELGGHSLLSMELVSKIRDAFAIELSLQKLFELPTVRQLAHYLDTSEKTAIQRIEKLNHKNALLSFQQERVYFIEHLDMHSTAYNMLATVEMSGKVVPEALERSLEKIIERHESLRTVFSQSDGQTQQIVMPPQSFNLESVDLTGLSVDESKDVLAKYVALYKDTKFDLKRDLMLKVMLIKMASDRYILLLKVHHLVSDDWSMNILLDELVSFYNHFVSGAKLSLPELPIQYFDYAVWQRENIDQNQDSELLKYWKEKLCEPIIPLNFPVDNPRPEQLFASDVIHFNVPNALVERLTSLARDMDGTLYMLLLAAYKLMLYRYTNQEDIIVGAPIANRRFKETEDLIGFFVNTLALRTDVSANLSFRDLFQRVRQTTLDAYHYQDYPFEKLVQASQLERDLQHHPFFDTLFNLVNTKKRREQFEDFQFKRLDLTQPDAKFLMTVYIEETSDGLEFSLVYRRNILAKPRMEAFMTQYQSLLRQIVEDSSLSIDEYVLENDFQRVITHQALQPQPLKHYDLIPTQLARSIKLFPERIALDSGTNQISYRELDSRVSQVALALLDRGLVFGQRVIIAGQRSVGSIVAILGVWRSGGVVVTLDTSFSKRRQMEIIDQVKPTFLIQATTFSEFLYQDLSLNVLGIDSNTGKLDSKDSFRDTEQNQVIVQSPSLSPGDPAYIFFTSGTTGVPKGVIGCHVGLAHFVTWQRDHFQICETDRVSHLTAISFDVILREILLPLTAGATLCIPPEETDVRSSKIIDWLNEREISVIHTVPTLARAWLQGTSSGSELSNLRWVFFAGEPLSDTLIANWRSRFHQGKIVNLYGPTETTLAKTFHEMGAEPRQGTQLIGKPLPETQILVLNRRNRICGVSEPGEICIRTPFRTLGYLNEDNPDRFQVNPFRSDPSDIIYRTGDLGFWTPDGLLAIAGRSDRQIKVRGVRIEPQEIESVLARHPDVRTALIASVKNSTDDNELVAYVVPQDLNRHSSAVELRAYLQSQLSRYMIPSFIMFIDLLPLSSNGKVDFSSLPVPTRSPISTPSVAPKSGLQSQIATIWQQVLDLEVVGVQDNFFDLGGHSLLMAQVQSRLSNVLAVDIPLVELFQYPTIATLATHLEANRQTAHNITLLDAAKARALRRKQRMQDK